MKQAFVIDANEIRQILAEKFNVPVENVIKSKYSFTVIKNDDEQKQENSNQN